MKNSLRRIIIAKVLADNRGTGQEIFEKIYPALITNRYKMDRGSLEIIIT